MIHEDYERYTCPVCGKNFTIYCASDMYGWQFNERLYCSYTCMRTDEKEFYEVNENKRVLPVDLKRVWLELLDWKEANRIYRLLRKKIYRNNREDLRDELKLIRGLRSAYLFKYKMGLSLLDKQEFALFQGYIKNGWSTDRTMNSLQITRDEACDIAIEICKKLKKQSNNSISQRREGLGVNA